MLRAVQGPMIKDLDRHELQHFFLSTAGLPMIIFMISSSGFDSVKMPDKQNTADSFT